MARKVTYNQDKVKELRMKVIMDSLLVFSGMAEKKISKWTQFRKDLLMKYAPRVLPNLVAGKDDDKDLIPVLVKFIDGKNNRNSG
uniref:Uncharacterized protein n=1 Tax=viral metagenome TaxID=1070528 RepID=A0A6H1ZHC1_9ZZZZ